MTKRASSFSGYSRYRTERSPEIPKLLAKRDLTGFRIEYWYEYWDETAGAYWYFRNRMLAERDVRVRGGNCSSVARVRVLTDGLRGWLLESSRTMAYVRAARTIAAKREARRARRRRVVVAATAT